MKLCMMDRQCTVMDFLNRAKEIGNRGDLAHVFSGDAEIPLDEKLEDYYDSSALFYVSTTDAPPPLDVSLTGTGSGMPVVTPGSATGSSTPSSDVLYYPPPPEHPRVFPGTGAGTGAAGGAGHGTADVEKSRDGVSPATIGTVSTELNEAASGPMKVYMTTDYASMTQGEEIPIQMDWDVRSLTDSLMPIVQRKSVIRDPLMLHVFLPGGIPFTKGKLSEFFSVPEFSNGQVRRAIYVVVTRRIRDDVLNRPLVELCDCSSEDMKLLLAPVVAQSDIGLTHIACLLGYLRHGGLKADDFLKSVATYTGFAPLICNVFRIMDSTVPIYGRNLVAITASLFCFYSHLIPPSPDKLFEYVLRCSCWVRSQSTR